MRGVEYGPGPHEVAWDGRDASGKLVPTGVYFCRLAAPGLVQTTRMTLIR